MTKLKDLQLPSDTVTMPNGERFAVRGLSVVDIAAIVRNRGPEVKALFARLTGASGGNDPTAINFEDMGELGASLFSIAPEIAVDIVAFGFDAGDPEGRAVAARLPFPIQLEAIEKVGKLTFEMEGGVKKVLEIVVRLFKGTRSAVAEVRASRSGSLASADK